MTKKLYRMVNTNLVDEDGLVYYLIKKDEYDVCQVFGKHTAKAIVDELNNLHDENEQLKHNNKMLSMKMSEVSTKYRLLKEFSEDTNPNEAVKTVLHELMMITKEYR